MLCPHCGKKIEIDKAEVERESLRANDWMTAETMEGYLEINRY